jgi:hypothetical protein
MLSTVLVLAILSGIAVMVYANGVINSTNTTSDQVYNYGDHYNGIIAPFGRHGCGKEFGGSITVSQEYKDNVISILQNDSDVQNLLASGYNITNVRPIISTIVEADGTVTMKAATAIVTLCQNTSGRAQVMVDVEQAKVTQIVILTKTVIEK